MNSRDKSFMDLWIFPSAQVAAVPFYLLSGIVDRDDYHAGSLFLLCKEKLYQAVKKGGVLCSGSHS